MLHGYISIAVEGSTCGSIHVQNCNMHVFGGIGGNYCIRDLQMYCSRIASTRLLYTQFAVNSICMQIL